MRLPLAGLVAVCLALSSAGGAELRRGEKVVSGLSWEAGRLWRLRAEAPLCPAFRVHSLGRASCPRPLLTLGGEKEGGKVVLGSHHPFEGDLRAGVCGQAMVPGANA